LIFLHFRLISIAFVSFRLRPFWCETGAAVHDNMVKRKFLPLFGSLQAK
jgi:hypothetical protein